MIRALLPVAGLAMMGDRAEEEQHGDQDQPDGDRDQQEFQQAGIYR